MICPHCEISTETKCYCDKPDTISSLEAKDDVKDLALDLSPLPITNERLWAVIEEHLKPNREKIDRQNVVLKHQDRLVDELMRRNEGARRYISDTITGPMALSGQRINKILNGEERYGEEAEGTEP